MTNKEVLDALFSEHDRFRYVQWLVGTSCLTCKIKSFCDSYCRNRTYNHCGVVAQAFLDAEVIKDGKINK